MKMMKYLFLLLFLVGNVQAEIAVNNDQLKIGLDLIQQKKFKLAEEHFIVLKQQFPDQVTYLNNLAVAQMAQGKTEQALENLNTVIAADKFFSVTQKNISHIYAYMASQAYSKALDKKDEPTPPELAVLSQVMTVFEAPAVAEEVTVEEAITEEIIPEQIISEEIVPEELAENPEAVLEEKTAAWASAWMEGNFKAYLSNYSDQFQPAGQLSYKDWLAQRRYRFRLSKDIQVSYNQLKVYIDSAKTTAIVEFVQQYKAGDYQDRVIKQLYWVLEGDNWLISQEQVTEKI